MSLSEFSSDLFRLFISHDSEGLPLATELRKQLLDYGIAAFAARDHDPHDPLVSVRSRIQAALSEMDGLVALVTSRFATNPWCNQEVGFALGKGVHLQCIALAAVPVGLATTSPQLLMPTDFDLPSLISRFVARDPLVSERLRPPAVEAILQRRGKALEKGLAFLECIAWPGSDSAMQLSEAREQLAGQLAPATMRRLERLIERWQELDADESPAKTLHFGPSRSPGNASPMRNYVPLAGPI